MPYLLYVLVFLLLAAVYEVVTDGLGSLSSQLSSFLVWAAVVMPVAVYAANRVGKVSYRALAGWSFVLWAVIWAGSLAVLKGVAAGVAPPVTVGALIQINKAEMATSALLIIVSAVVWQFLLIKVRRGAPSNPASFA